MQHTNKLIISKDEVLSRRDYQEILLARMAGGDLYANEERLRIRQVDICWISFGLWGGKVLCNEAKLLLQMSSRLCLVIC